MQLDTSVKGNEELYGDDIELIPLNLDAVDQRINYFGKKVKATMHGDQSEFYKYHKAWEHWKGIKENHCLKETR